MASLIDRGSIVRRIWGDRTLVLLIFAGAAAEFVVNRAFDWLFFTGTLPGDPLGRLFATARVAQDIILVEAAAAETGHALHHSRVSSIAPAIPPAAQILSNPR